jgi:hypothetical protein
LRLIRLFQLPLINGPLPPGAKAHEKEVHLMSIRSKRIALALAALGVLGLASQAAASGYSNPAPVTRHYHPHIDPADFVGKIDNRYLPFNPGTRTVAKGVAEDGKTPQRDVQVVTDRTRKVDGVKCRVVRDTITSRGKPVEKTFDWYAQDKRGNVWYFGENSKDYKHGHWVKSDGSWEGGVHGAQPGIMMEAHPKRGDAYRQEYYRGHAEDQAKVLGITGRVTVPAGTFRHTIGTKETSRLEPGVVERKWYARGVGEIKSQDVKGSKEGFRLVKVTH